MKFKFVLPTMADVLSRSLKGFLIVSYAYRLLPKFLITLTFRIFKLGGQVRV